MRATLEPSVLLTGRRWSRSRVVLPCSRQHEYGPRLARCDERAHRQTKGRDGHGKMFAERLVCATSPWRIKTAVLRASPACAGPSLVRQRRWHRAAGHRVKSVAVASRTDSVWNGDQAEAKTMRLDGRDSPALACQSTLNAGGCVSLASACPTGCVPVGRLRLAALFSVSRATIYREIARAHRPDRVR